MNNKIEFLILKLIIGMYRPVLHNQNQSFNIFDWKWEKRILLLFILLKWMFTYSHPIRVVWVVHVRANVHYHSLHGVRIVNDVLHIHWLILVAWYGMRQQQQLIDLNSNATNRIPMIIDLTNRLPMDMVRCRHLLVCCSLAMYFVLGSMNLDLLMCLTVDSTMNCWQMVNSSGDCMSFGSTNSSDVHLFAVRSYYGNHSNQSTAIGMMTSMALMTPLYLAVRPMTMDDAGRTVMKMVTINLLGFRRAVTFHANLCVCVSVHDDLKTTLEHELQLVWFFVPILHANIHLDIDFWQTIVPAHSTVRWWMLYVNDVVYVLMVNQVQNQCHFHQNYHHHMMNVLFV